MVRKQYKWLVCLSVFLLLTACSPEKPAGEKIAPFTFTNESGEAYGSEDLEGEVWIADFIFTQCETVCPQMTTEMIRLAQALQEEDLDVTFISFTVDPAIDTPEVMQAYMEDYPVDDMTWHMLTGYSQVEIETFAREQFHTIVQKPDSSNQVIHGTNFYLMDTEGYLINEYNYNEVDYIEEVIEDLHDIKK